MKLGFALLVYFLCSLSPLEISISPACICLCVQMDSAEGRRGKRQARQEVERAEERERKYGERLANLGGSSLPSVEIGCLEEIIASMEADQSGTWSSVMFVPPGVMADTAAPQPA